jgi:hypothetical protein
MLYPLSYAPVATNARLERATSGVGSRRSILLS